MNENVRDTVREKAAGLADGAKEQARSQYDQKKGVALGELDTLASALRRASSEMSDSSGLSGRLITTVADRVESIGRSLDGKDLDDVVSDVERFARRNPAAFIGSAVALGFLASRFLKASSGRSMQRGDFYSSEAYGGYTAGGSDSAIGSAGYYSGGMDSDRGTAGSGFGTTGSGLGATGSGLGTAGSGLTGSGLGASGTYGSGLGTPHATDFDTPSGLTTGTGNSGTIDSPGAIGTETGSDFDTNNPRRR